MVCGRKEIFVIGTGRSGTCWVGDILGLHPEIQSFVEPQPVFDWVTEAAHSPLVAEELLPRIVAEYRRLADTVRPRHFADKSHPGIWIAEELAAAFPNSYFLGVTREVVPTVASMLKHSGVRRWCEEWERYPLPNRFLGISKGNVDWYREATILERCVARWYSHTRELTRLADVLRSRFHLVSYEQLVSHPARSLSGWQDFLGLQRRFPEISADKAGLRKWRSQLSESDLLCISSAIEFLDGVACETAV